MRWTKREQKYYIDKFKHLCNEQIITRCVEYINAFHSETHYDPQVDPEIEPFIEEKETAGYKEYPQITVRVCGVSYITVVRDIASRHPLTTVLQAATKLENMACDRVKLTPYKPSHDLKIMLSALNMLNENKPADAFHEALDNEVSLYVTQTMDTIIQHLIDRTPTLPRIGDAVRKHCRKKYNCSDSQLLTAVPWPDIKFRRNGMFAPTFQYMIADDKKN